MGDRCHAHVVVTRWLWEEVCNEVVEHWEDLDVRGQNQARDRVIKRWRSLRDCFKKEFNKEMQAPSGSGGCRSSKYNYAIVLSFLRSTMVSSSTICSTRESAESNPSEEIPQESATGNHFDRPDPSAPSLPSLTFVLSVPSTSAGASWQTSLHEAAGEDVAFPLPYPSDTAATYRTPLGSGRQRHRGQEKNYAPEFLHLNACFQNSLKLLSEQIPAGFNLMNNSLLEMSTHLDRMHLNASKSPNHSFFQAVVERIDKLSPDQQMHVMQACQFALTQVSSQAPPPAPVVPPAPASPPATVPPPLPVQYQLPALYQFPTTASAPPLPAQPVLDAHYHQSSFSHPSCPKYNPLLHPPPLLSPNPSTPHPYQIPFLLLVLSTHPLGFSTPSPCVSDLSPPQSTLHTPTVEVVRSISPSSTISTPNYLNL
ncbi:uncharacterized protein LOC143769290 [Ranitomeya variabilis]|uniref:uncharacterized protein LOC143769290 n=1 Tax=Ranitomeya variabilis TaxID=490064 RepID=UPI0040569F9E